MLAESIRSYYMEGFCYYIAVALHYEYRFKFGFLGYKTKNGIGLYHAFNVLPDGLCLDIEGVKTLDSILAFYKWENQKDFVVSCPCDFPEFKQLMSPVSDHFNPNYFEVINALQHAKNCIPDLDKYAKPCLDLKMSA